MAWRGLHLSRPSRLALADGQLVVGQDDGEVRLALEDLAWLVIDTPQVSLTSALLSACAERGVAVIVTDATHTPSGLLLPFHRHFRQAEVAHQQVAMSVPLRKRLWQALVQAKIANQAAVLEALGHEGGPPLREMARRVGSGDPDHLEATAARAYWSRLWPAFRRDDDQDHRNKLLNYGYAVVRSAVARAVVAVGLLPSLGLNHASVSNAFNLADDLVEPFRPFVDLLAWRVAGDGAPGTGSLGREDRQAMTGVLLRPARLGNDTVTLLVATEQTAESLVRAIDSGTSAPLLTPALVP
jgi:CRISPR-associated protein Cas1